MRTAHRVIAVFTVRLSPVPSRRHTTGRVVSKTKRAARGKEGEDGRGRGRGKGKGARGGVCQGEGTRDYWAPKPRITGITPRIRNRARGRQSATVFAVPVPPLPMLGRLPLFSPSERYLHLSRFLLLSLSSSPILPHLPLFAVVARFNAKPRRLVVVFHRSPGEICKLR